MDEVRLRVLLEALQRGEVGVEDVLKALRHLPFERVSDTVQLDHHRALRQGFPEFVYGEGKRAEEVAAILLRQVERQNAALATRIPPEMVPLLRERVPDLEHDPVARVVWVGGPLRLPGYRSLQVTILTAGTSDVPVAEEAARVAQFLGHEVRRHYDVGVAGIHRLLDVLGDLWQADALIVVAGMEGALPSVVGGLVARPVIAVPTSVGYGAHLGGVSPLFAMLNSCAGGVTVVNIDNGFGAALAVHRMAKLNHEG